MPVRRLLLPIALVASSGCVQRPDLTFDNPCDPRGVVEPSCFAGDAGPVDAAEAGPDARPPDGRPPDDGVPVDADPPDSGLPVDASPPVDAGYARLEFIVDDRANATYTAVDGLAWKGSLSFFDGELHFDPGWSGPFPLLYDDGPWTAGGNEPAEAAADDNVWGCSVLFRSPERDQPFEFGLIRDSVDGSDGYWIWPEPLNGTTVVPAGSTATILAARVVLPAFGDIDVRLTLDIGALAAEFAEYDSANGVWVKSNLWGWSEIAMSDDGTRGDTVGDDDIFTFLLSEHIGPGSAHRHTGLPASGDEVQFVFVLGGVEYKIGGVPVADGVGAETRNPGNGQWEPAPVRNQPDGDMSTYIVAP